MGQKLNMKYIYTNEGCSKCERQKAEWGNLGTKYEERSADRIKAPVDSVDLEALVLASMQNMELPVIVEV